MLLTIQFSIARINTLYKDFSALSDAFMDVQGNAETEISVAKKWNGKN
jgi:hypothetical protein